MHREPAKSKHEKPACFGSLPSIVASACGKCAARSRCFKRFSEQQTVDILPVARKMVGRPVEVHADSYISNDNGLAPEYEKVVRRVAERFRCLVDPMPRGFRMTIRDAAHIRVGILRMDARSVRLVAFGLEDAGVLSDFHAQPGEWRGRRVTVVMRCLSPKQLRSLLATVLALPYIRLPR